jgi:hypothetical protein
MATFFNRQPFYNFCTFKTIDNTFPSSCGDNTRSNARPLRCPKPQARRAMAGYDAEGMSSLLWQIRRDREQRQQEEIRDRRARRNMNAHENGWVNPHSNSEPRRQFEDGEEDEDDVDDEVYEGA